MKISVVVNTFNSERFLDRCLSSVDGFDEIVLCDMHSADSTISIAERHGCRIVYHERTGFVEPARNYAISQAANEWVLVLDSDEVIPAALKDYLYRFAETAEARGYAALKMARKNYFMGRFMHGDYPAVRRLSGPNRFMPVRSSRAVSSRFPPVAVSWLWSTWPTKASPRGSPRRISIPTRR